MKQILSILILLLALGANAQKKDSTKKDTTFIPVYVYDKIDTVKVNLLLYMGKWGVVKYSKPGYLILKGQVLQTENGNQQPIGTQKPIGALTNKKKAVKPI